MTWIAAPNNSFEAERLRRRSIPSQNACPDTVLADRRCLAVLAIPTLLLLYLFTLAGFDPRPDGASVTANYIKAKPTLVYLAFAAPLLLRSSGKVQLA